MTTANYGWDQPTPNEPLRDGAKRLRDLGDAVDAALTKVAQRYNPAATDLTRTTYDFPYARTLPYLTHYGNSGATGGLRVASGTTAPATPSIDYATWLGMDRPTWDGYLQPAVLWAPITPGFTPVAAFVTPMSALRNGAATVAIAHVASFSAATLAVWVWGGGGPWKGFDGTGPWVQSVRLCWTVIGR
jgi:hypothetical protein